MRRGAHWCAPGLIGSRISVRDVSSVVAVYTACRAYEPPTTMQVTVRTIPDTVWTSRVTI